MKGDCCIFDLPVRKDTIEATLCGLKKQHRTILCVAGNYLLKLINNSSKLNKENHDRDGV